MFNLKLDPTFLKNLTTLKGGTFQNGLPALQNIPISAPEQNFDFEGFNPNAGRQEAYDKRWNNYLNILAADNDNINIKKARTFFDSQFEQDWNNEENFRKALFNSNMFLIKNRNELNLAFDDYDLNITNDFKQQVLEVSTPKVKENMDWWLKEAQKVNPNFKSIEDVINWLKENGLAEIDGKFGKNSLAKWLDLQNSSEEFDPTKERANETLIVPVIKEDVPTTTSQTPVNNLYGQNTFKGDKSYWFRNSLIDDIKRSYLNLPKNIQGNLQSRELQLIWNSPEYAKYELEALANYSNPGEELPQGQDMGGVSNSPGVKFFRNLLGFYTRKNKNGGIINKFQQGGNMNDQDIKEFMAFLIEDAKALGINLLTEQDILMYAEQLGEERLKAKYQEFMLKMQGSLVARLGAKLNYIKKLKGNCPEGEELVYFKKGGRVCKACQGKKAEKGAKVDKKDKDVIAEWKKLQKNKRMDLASKDSIAANKFGDLEIMNDKPGNFKKGVWTPDRSKAPYKKK